MAMSEHCYLVLCDGGSLANAVQIMSCIGQHAHYNGYTAENLQQAVDMI